MDSRLPSLALRRKVVAAITARIAHLGVTQAEAAERLAVSQPRVNALLRGRCELFSLDTLVNLASRLGLEARIEVVRPHHPR
ncbi:MAG TPA: XRE family transcriptional regulator [Burkholderiales bacterium]|nr:XRE family transcriptional regulator [Burkholderiales bacterium]